MNITVQPLLRANVIKSELFIRSHRSQWEFGRMPLGNTDALHRAGGRSTNCMSSGIFSSYSKWNTAQHHESHHPPSHYTETEISADGEHVLTDTQTTQSSWMYEYIVVSKYCIIIINIIAIPCYWSTICYHHCLP